jgi:alginate O-acetyltransferase complex protein AlgJ
MIDRLPKLRTTRPGERHARLAHWLPGVFMLAALALGLTLALLTPATFRAPPNGDVLSGEWAKSYQTAFEEALVLREVVVPTWGALRYALFREGQPGVLIGEGDWLFTREEFAYYPDETQTLRENLAFIAEVKAELDARGIQLVIALVPAKARVYPERLGRYVWPEYAARRYRAVREALLVQGFAVPDLHALLEETKTKGEVFLRTDTHWTPLAAQAVAGELAREAAQLGVDALQQEHYALHETGTERYEGDLLTFLPLGPFQALGPKPDLLTRYELERPPREVGLFDEVTIPVTLVGTSYSAHEAWQFANALKVALGADVLNLAEEGLGPFVPMKRYLESDSLAQSPPELVVWEIPERYLPVAYDLENGRPLENGQPDDPYQGPF